MSQRNKLELTSHQRKLQLMGLALVVVAVAYMRTALSYGSSVKGGTVEPGVLPLVLGGVLLFLSILLVFTANRNIAPEGQEDKDGRRAFTRSAQFFLALVSYVGLVTLIGFLIATLVAVGSILRLLFNYSYRWSIVYSVGITLICYAVFVLGLGVRLP